MKVVVAGYGSRGDVEPCVAAGRELLRRGHDVRMAVPPNMLGFVESAGLAGVAYGPDSREELDAASDLFRKLLPKMTKNPLSVLPEVIERVTRVKLDKGATLTALANGADLVLAGFNEQGLAANVAEYYGIPVVALHPFPEQIWSSEWLARMTKIAEDAQRRELGLPEGTAPSARSLDIQAYEELCLPAVAAQWGCRDDRRPFVGALTLELPTDVDQEVLTWIADGTPPIYFGLGSTLIAPADDTIAMVSATCAQLGDRALICSGPNDFTHLEQFDHVKIVPAVNHAAIFPACRAVIHHGGAGTTAAGLRAGIPTLILWQSLDQPIWAAGVQELEVGLGRRLSETNVETLVADLRLLLGPQYAARAGEIAVRVTKSADSLARAADLLEETARRGR